MAPPQRWQTSKLLSRKLCADSSTQTTCSATLSPELSSWPSHKGGEHKLCTRLDPSSCPWRTCLVHRLCSRTPPSSSGHRWTHWGTWWCTAMGPGWDLAPPSSLCKDVVRKPDDNRMHHYIKPCFTVLRIYFFHFNSSAGSFYKDEKMAKNTEFETVSSDVPWKKILKLALSLFLADLVDGNPTTKWRKRFFSTRRVWAKLFETVSNPRKNSFLKSNNQNLDFKGCVGKVPRF